MAKPAKKIVKSKTADNQYTAADILEDNGNDARQATKLVDKLNKKIGTKVTLDDYAMWLTGEGKGNYDKFHKAVIKLIGKQATDIGESYARLDNLLLYALGMGVDDVGGISMKAILDTTKPSTDKSKKAPPKSAPTKAADNPKTAAQIKEVKAAMRKLAPMKSVSAYIKLAKKLAKLQG